MKSHIEGITHEYFDKHKLKLYQIVFGRVRMPRKIKKKFGSTWKFHLDEWYLRRIENMRIKRTVDKGFLINLS